MSSWQVFGLAGCLLAPASQLVTEPVLMSKRSFLLTAAGQFRLSTGFPFQPELAIRHRDVKPTLSRGSVLRQPKVLGVVCKSSSDPHDTAWLRKCGSTTGRRQAHDTQSRRTC